MQCCTDWIAAAFNPGKPFGQPKLLTTRLPLRQCPCIGAGFAHPCSPCKTAVFCERSCVISFSDQPVNASIENPAGELLGGLAACSPSDSRRGPPPAV